MRYFLKVYGSAKSTISSVDFDEMGKLDGASYYFLNSKIYFGEKLPADYSIGDILIQYVPLSQKVDKAGRILGVYQSTSGFKQGCIRGVGVNGNLKEFVNYIDVINLSHTFSDRSRKKNLLNMHEEKNNIDFPTGKIAIGFAYLSEKDARYLIDKIKSHLKN